MADVAEIIASLVAQFGSEAKAARAVGVSQPVIHEAKKTGRVGPRTAIGIEAATNGAVSRSALRPDLWPAPPADPPPATPPEALP